MNLENFGFYSNSSIILPESNGCLVPMPLPMNFAQGVSQFQQSFGSSQPPLLSKRSNQYELSDTLEKRTRLPDGAIRVEVIPVNSPNVLNNDQHFYQIGDLAAQANWGREGINAMAMNDVASLHWQISQQNSNLKSSAMSSGLEVIPVPDLSFREWNYPISEPMMLQEGQFINIPKNNFNINGSSQVQFILAPLVITLPPPPNPVIILDQNQLNASTLGSSVGFDFSQNNNLVSQGECFSFDGNLELNLANSKLLEAFFKARGITEDQNVTEIISINMKNDVLSLDQKKEEKNSENSESVNILLEKNSEEKKEEQVPLKNSNNGTRIKSFVDLIRRKKEKTRFNPTNEDKIKGAIEIKSFEINENPRKRRNLKLKWSPENNGSEFLKLSEEVEKILQMDINHEKLIQIFQENDYNFKKTIELVQSNVRKYTKFFDLKQRRQKFPSQNVFF